MHSMIVLLLVLFGLSISSISAWREFEVETREVSNDLERLLARWSYELQHELAAELNELAALRITLNHSPPISTAHFTTITSGLVQQGSKILSLAWVPIVPASERARYESQMEQKFPAFQFIQRSSENKLEPASPQSVHLPVYYLTSQSGTTVYFPPGFDLVSSAHKQTLMLLIESPEKGAIAALKGAHGVAGTDTEALISFHSVYGESDPPSVSGFLMATLKPPLYFKQLQQDAETYTVNLAIKDKTLSGLEISVVKFNGSIKQTDDHYQLQSEIRGPGGSAWSIIVSSTETYFSSRRSQLPLVIFVSGVAGTLLLLWYMNYLYRNVYKQELEAERCNQALMVANKELKHISSTDLHTGLANRRYFESHLDSEWKRARREEQALTVIIVGMDFFTAYNQYYGYSTANESLKKVAQAVASCVSRPADIVARYSDDKFVFLLPYTQSPMDIIAQRCRYNVEQEFIAHRASEIAEHVTVSAGVYSIIPSADSTTDQLLLSAFNALEKAQSQGGNRVVCA